MFEFAAAPAHRIRTLADISAVLSPSHSMTMENRVIGRFRSDSRMIAQGDVFVAIKGNRSDGHDFVDQCFARGAAAAIVATTANIQNAQRCFTVSNPVKALGYLAASHRRALNTKIIAITGSVGKTTTKEILFKLLSYQWKCAKSQGNFNSTIGLPMELLKLNEKDEYMVAEMGMSTPGEIASLMALTTPDLALWLCVKAVHQANFADLDGIARAKGEMVDGLGDDKILIYNGDDQRVAQKSQTFCGRRVCYSIMHTQADIRARIPHFSTWKETSFELTYASRSQMLHLPMVGHFNSKNAIAACATALTCGMTFNELSFAIQSSEPEAGRCTLHQLPDGTQLVDDTYNSNPHAVKQVLRSFASLAPQHFRWLILGDMLELGPDENQIHHQLGQRLLGYAFDRITLVGSLCAHTHEVLSSHGQPEVSWFPDREQAISGMDFRTPAGARIWFKGSRGIGLEAVCQHVLTQLNKT